MHYLLFLMAIVPSAVLLWLFISNDRYPEPAGALLFSFLLGVLIVLGIYLIYPFLQLVELILPTGNPYAVGAWHAFLLAALPEESLKLIVLRRYCVSHPAFDEPMDGIVYGVTVSLGFATAENLLYVMNGGMSVAVGRAFLAVPCHALVGAVMGYHVGRAAFTKGERVKPYLKAFLLPVLLHGLYDFAPLTFRAAESMNWTLPTPATVGLNLLFGAVIFVMVQYVATITRSVRTMQQAGQRPGFGFSRVLPRRGRPKYPHLEDSRLGGVIKAYKEETGPMDLLFSLLCLIGLFCALAGAAHMGKPSDPSALLPLVVAVLFFVYGIGFAARGMGKMAVRMVRERDSQGKGQ